MKIIIFLAVCFTFCESKAQLMERDSLEMIFQIINQTELDKKPFLNINHSPNSIFIIYNIADDEHFKKFPPREYQFKGLHIFFYNRAYIAGHDINYWMIIDSISQIKSDVKVVFRTVKSDENWLAKFDRTDLTGVIEFRKVNSDWEIVKKKIKKK